MSFAIRERDQKTGARNGELRLAHGRVATPVFMPVGTNATVKACSNEDLDQLGLKLILGNAYHLYLRPGIDVIERAGGLHAFMSWQRNILTDSGGFQIFSLTPFRKVEEEGVHFRSHLDGSSHMLTPEKVVGIQHVLGSDIIMPLDVCTPAGVDRQEASAAVRLTSEWAGKSLAARRDLGESCRGELFAIVQGNFYRDLRRESASYLVERDFCGYAVGGLSVGESFEEFREYLAYSASLLPEDKPRYTMGIGTPPYLLEAVENGIDMFDCVYPTRIARNALAFTRRGNLSLRRESNRYDALPIDPECDCRVCLNYSRSYLRHLFKAKEITAAVLTTYHNLFFIRNFVLEIRQAITAGKFSEFKRDFLASFEGPEEEKEENLKSRR